MKIKHLHLWDFDGTCVYSPEPTEGKIIYEQQTGKKWPHVGWWSKLESLDPNIFYIPINQYVKNLYDEAKKQENSYNVLATGRIKIFKPHVENILLNHGYHFDELHFNYMRDTQTFKLKLFTDLVNDLKPLYVDIYDDRNEHVPGFLKFVQDLKDKNINAKFHHIK